MGFKNLVLVVVVDMGNTHTNCRLCRARLSSQRGEAEWSRSANEDEQQAPFKVVEDEDQAMTQLEISPSVTLHSVRQIVAKGKGVLHV